MLAELETTERDNGAEEIAAWLAEQEAIATADWADLTPFASAFPSSSTSSSSSSPVQAPTDPIEPTHAPPPIPNSRNRPLKKTMRGNPRAGPGVAPKLRIGAGDHITLR